MRKSLWALVGLVGLLPSALQGQEQGQQKCPAPGLKMVAKLSSPISTKSSRKNNPIAAQVIDPPEFVNAILEGKITEVAPAHKNAMARITFAFERLTVGSKRCGLSFSLETVVNSKGQIDADEFGQVVGKQSKKKRVAGTVVGSGIGAALGALAGGGSGAVEGAAAGAVAGFLLAYTLTTSGSDLQFDPGSEFHLQVSGKSQ